MRLSTMLHAATKRDIQAKLDMSKFFDSKRDASTQETLMALLSSNFSK